MNPQSCIPQCGLRELEIYYLQVFHLATRIPKIQDAGCGMTHNTYKNAPASPILKFRDAGCRMENLQIINFKLPQPALRDAGFGIRDVE